MDDINLMEISKLEKSFGGLNAVQDFNFHIAENELVGLIGPNGAGKTTVFNLITGVYKPDNGCIMFRDENLVGMAPTPFAPRVSPGPFRTSACSTISVCWTT